MRSVRPGLPQLSSRGMENIQMLISFVQLGWPNFKYEER